MDWNRQQWTRIAAILVGWAFVVGCNGDGCDIDGFSEAPYPESSYDQTQPGSAEVRLTSHGLTFMEGQVDNLLGEFMEGDDGLSFCIPPTETDEADICHEDATCSDGSPGCQVDLQIDDIGLNPEQPDELVADLTVTDLYKDEDIPISIHTWPNPDCWLDLYDAGDDDLPADIPVTAGIQFSVDDNSALDDIRIDIGDIDVNIDDVGYGLTGRDGDGLSCGGFNVVIQWFLDDILSDMIAGEIDGIVDDLSRDQLCRSCDDGELPCPSNSNCEPGDDDEVPLCMYDDDECVPQLLGIEGLLELDEFIGDFVPGDVADLYATGRVADRAEADTGLSLAMRAGIDPEHQSLCAPVNPTARPSFETIDPAPSINDDYTPDGDEFMFGLGLHQRTIEHILWSLWASGALCAEIGHEQVDMLTTTTIGALVDSIGDIATRPAPMTIRLSPQQAPDVRLGDNTVVDGDVQEGLMTLEWNDLDVHMYGHVQERYARLFTLRMDLELPIAVVADGDDGILPVLGDFEEAFDNLRILGDELVEADEETFEELIPMLLDVAVPELLDALDEPIELPEFLGYRVVIDDGDITAVDDDEYVGLFANLEYVGLDDTSLGLMAARATIDNQHLDVDRVDGQIPEVSLRLDVGAEQSGLAIAGSDAEYLYRIGGGPWRPAGTGPELVIDDPRLIAQGVHELELRARRLQPGQSWQQDTTGQDVIVDYEPPTVDAWQVDDAIAVSATDVVDDTDDLQMRYRHVVDGQADAWTEWTSVDDIELDADTDSGDIAVDIEVRDRADWVGDDRVEVRPQPLEPSTDAAAPAAEPRTGCSSSGAPTGGLVGGLMVLLLLAVRRFSGASRRWLAIVAVAAVALTACSDDTASEHTTCPEQCPDGEACIDDECVVPSCDDTADCTDVECDESGYIGVCEGDECTCALACDGECESDQFCCHMANGCATYPDPCADQQCDEGFEPQVVEYGDVDQETCQAGDGECECVSMEPLPLRYHGSYPSIDSDDGLTAVAVHNIGYGDLMVAELSGTNVGTWNFVDGIPDGGVIGGDLNGPRGGVITYGDEVGTHTATAVDGDREVVHVFYRSEEDNSLLYAQGHRGDQRGPEHDEFDFDITTVEDDVDTGYYSQVVLRDDVLELFYVARLDGESSEIRHRSIDVDTAIDDVEDTDYTVLHSGSRPTVDLEDYPQVAGLFLQIVEGDDGQLFASFFDNTRQQVGWLTEYGTQWTDATYLDVDTAGPYASVRRDSDGDIHIAYMDRSEPALFYQTEGGDREYIVDGIRDTVGGWSQTPVGHDVQLHVDGDHIEVIYHDASTHELRRVTRNGDDEWSGQTLAGQAGETSPGHGLFARTVDVGPQRVVVDFTVDTTEDGEPVAHPSFHTLD